MQRLETSQVQVRNGRLAQLVERLFIEQEVGGSSPVVAAIMLSGVIEPKRQGNIMKQGEVLLYKASSVTQR